MEGTPVGTALPRESSRLARAAAAFAARGQAVTRQQLDEMLRVLTPEPSGSEVEAELVERGLLYLADLLAGGPPPGRRHAGAGCVVWITGLPGSGKTTIAWGVADALAGLGMAVRVLDVADVRAWLTGGDVTPPGETIAHRVLAVAARRLSDAGEVVIVDASAPARRWRDLARALVRPFAEVQLICPPGVCHTRERAVRWGLAGASRRPRARRPSAGPDVVVAYEHALDPELIIDTHVEDPWSAVEHVRQLIARLQATDRPDVAR